MGYTERDIQFMQKLKDKGYDYDKSISLLNEAKARQQQAPEPTEKLDPGMVQPQQTVPIQEEKPEALSPGQFLLQTMPFVGKKTTEKMGEIVGETAGEVKEGAYQLGEDISRIQTDRLDEEGADLGLLGRTVKTFGDVQEEIKEAKTAEVMGEQTGTESVLQSMALLGGGIIDVAEDTFLSTLQTLAPEEAEKATADTLKAIMETKGGEFVADKYQEALKNYEDLKEVNPTKARRYKAIFRALEGGGELVGLGTLKKGATAGVKTTLKKGAEEVIEQVGERAKTMIKQPLEKLGERVRKVEDVQFVGKPGEGIVKREVTPDVPFMGEKVEKPGFMDKIKTEGIAPQKAYEQSTKANRFKKGKEEQFLAEMGESTGEWAVKRGMTKVGDEAVEEAIKFWKKSMDEADFATDQIKGNYRVQKGVDFVEGAIEGLQQKLSKFSPDIKKVNRYAKKYLDEGLTMTEINDLKRLYARKHKYSWIDSGKKEALKSKDIQDGLRKWQFGVAKKEGLSNLDEINKTTKGWKFYADNLAENIGGKGVNNNVSLTDWVVLSGGDPANLALFLGKKLGQSSKIRSAIIKKLGKQTKPAITKAKIKQKPQLALPYKGGKQSVKTKILPSKRPIRLPKDLSKSRPKTTKTLPSKPITKRTLKLPYKSSGKIITPQTKEKGVIIESKKPLKSKLKKYDTNNRVSTNRTISRTEKLITTEINKLKGPIKTPQQINKVSEAITKSLNVPKAKAKEVLEIVKKYVRKYGAELKDKLGDLMDEIADKTGARLKFVDDRGVIIGRSKVDESFDKWIKADRDIGKYGDIENYIELSDIGPNNKLKSFSEIIKGKKYPTPMQMAEDAIRFKKIMVEGIEKKQSAYKSKTGKKYKELQKKKEELQEGINYSTSKEGLAEYSQKTEKKIKKEKELYEKKKGYLKDKESLDQLERDYFGLSKREESYLHTKYPTMRDINVKEHGLYKKEDWWKGDVPKNPDKLQEIIKTKSPNIDSTIKENIDIVNDIYRAWESNNATIKGHMASSGDYNTGFYAMKSKYVHKAIKKIKDRTPSNIKAYETSDGVTGFIVNGRQLTFHGINDTNLPIVDIEWIGRPSTVNPLSLSINDYNDYFDVKLKTSPIKTPKKLTPKPLKSKKQPPKIKSPKKIK